MLQRNLIQDIEKSIVKNWDQHVFSDYGYKGITYGKLAHKILLWHQIFKENNIQQNDKIAFVGRNSSNWAEIYLSVITYGAVVVPILPDFTPENIHHIVNHSNSVVLFAADNIYENLDKDKMNNLEMIFSLNDFSCKYFKSKNSLQRINSAKAKFSRDFSNSLAQNNFNLPAIPNDHVAAIVYTSGTTGFSKGVMLDVNSLTANIVYAQENMPLSPGDRILSFLPLAHAYACAFEFLFPVTIGCSITFLNKLPTPQILLKAFSEVKPKLIFLVPLLIEKIYKNKIKPAIEKDGVKLMMKIPGLRNVVYNKVKKTLTDAFGGSFIEVVIGGAAVNPEVETFLKKIKFPFTVGYGMTECGPLISYASWETTKLHSVGKVINFLDIKIDSKDQENEVGEILVKGQNVMKGYYKYEEATKETIEPDGWLHTGDLGIIDKEGFIFIKGRSKNMILGPTGQNIYPEEIESKLNNLDFVQESLVMDINNKLIALVYPDFEKADKEKVYEKKLDEKMKENLKLLNENLPSYSKISSIRLFPEEFEKTPTKKIKRYLYAHLKL